MSSPPRSSPLAPKRQRGRDRVEAILTAATTVFGEKSYEAATMTEIAARASTAIGSLYRFFPTKDVLAAAVLERYGARLLHALDELVDHDPPLSPRDAAEGLLDIIQRLRTERSVVLSLLDSGITLPDGTRTLRKALIGRMSQLLSRLGGSPGPHDERAVMLLHLVKAIFALPQDHSVSRPAQDKEAVTVLRLYLEHAVASR
ncbi:TetR/AcrR family transcriptional regulator (plasmid) [Komagataeibacter nataicola]|uniref:TetR/AcrR family transcriptional regulator n=2 Tax=Komagataeibacter TaxID=1434011 RepID=A0ABX2ABW4_9PROT|nr:MULTISPECIES: TetR/AcrR family transcriptional regulator [Komagataeibacter]MBV0889187.1 TetR/AcrR family transcriptional regulator [Komagataeibacter oboediens]MBV1830185.1 TetR/AcrR family transcriptional regulator [Komagataeibacter melomenusus]MCK9821243.1 TetR/AcrR family transcriptional regulator [Komagataeibacter oboediens]NPC65725.1 TetR/AcrR family transcriptional regulator [Komagataeibacter melomenusus]WEQ57504.1 TetR/AcrR family transcriptional regulator [Komagataeibacter nataicola]